ncbi:MAG: type II secretion system F family protein [Pseudomonadota bacterium]|nr:type II secretion system F family protein [Pseudomonadota bacterium]
MIPAIPQDMYPQIILGLIGIAGFLLVEALCLSIANRASYVRKVNARLQVASKVDDRQELLVQLRRNRSLGADGRFSLPVIWFNRLLLQSGAGIGVWRMAVYVLVFAAIAYAAVYRLDPDPLVAGPAALLASLLVPTAVLKFMCGRRRSKFEAQLPDAVDVVVRSLRAGHPLPVAIAMVGREMPDPIGSEFGITADELTYGLDLETAMNNMSARVGQDDFNLVVVAVSIQSKSGGNLSEVLGNLSRVLRARFKMRRRVKALSAEGRFSALALSALPFGVLGALMGIAPDYYSSVAHVPIVKTVLGCALGFMAVGNVIMYRMVNFKL